MSISASARTAAALHRKLRALAAVLLDPNATQSEKVNAQRLKDRLEQRLEQQAPPQGSWEGIMFRLGRGIKEITSAPSRKDDWKDRAFRAGRMLRNSFNKGKSN